MTSALDEQYAAASAAAAALLREVLPGAVEVALSPGLFAAALGDNDYPMCGHLAALPCQPTVFCHDGVARCRPCFGINWIIHPRLACQACDHPEASAVVAARAGHLVAVMAVCASCRPPDPLTGQHPAAHT